ncbi:MAG: hypothetical protein H6839_05900 [Planctomycetes bacterium]|nr:hypothetical protein [Planctomycetota bacterium]
MQKLTWTAALAVALLLLAQPRPADADANFGVTPDKKLAKALADLADTCFECGDMAKGKGLYTYARSYFSHGLEFDTDHKKIRKVMGFERKKGAWVLEEDMIPLTDKINESKRDELVEKLRVETAPLREKAAEKIWKFVEDTELPAPQRMLALYYTLQLFPEHRGAQKAARCMPANWWYRHQLDDEADTNREVWIQRADAGQAFEEKSPYEEQSGLPMSKRRTKHLITHMDMGDKGPEWAKNLAQFGEACRTRISELLGIDLPKEPTSDDQRLHYTVLIERDRFARFVEKCSGIPDASDRKTRAETSGGTPVYKPYGACWFYPNYTNDFGVRDGMAHDLGYKEMVRHFGSENYYWLIRGFGYVLSTQMNGSTSSRFFAVKSTGVIDTGGAESLPGLGNCAAGWRLHVAMTVAGDKPLTLSDLVKMRPQDYGQDETAAAFCFTDYLLHAHKEKLGEFMKNAYEEFVARYKEKKPAESASELLQRMLTVLGTNEPDFMTAFKTWAIANYIDLPSGEDK